MTPLTRIIRVAVAVEVFLLLGFLPTLFNPNAHLYGGPGGGWDWSPWCFISPMAAVLFVAGLMIDLAIQKISHPLYRAIVIAIIILPVLTMWAIVVRSD